MDDMMEKLVNMSFYPVLLVGLVLISALFVLMFRFAEAENLGLVLSMALLISFVSVLIVRFIVYKRKYGGF
ncbi:hypothetical protein MSMTP_2072 [Methanosarcina sp. MTP4]|uniref:hypothetical protein n=1 Tax=Methanosarcina sp. MTP4 TaxID=1434100 RepID=UPI000615C8C9|nr:hypothetical protein [Methanosarcina sp. MTP4]AKB25541.1 hypothetical protein MSMTP_2072 [Methanosarcina sp. MTP4]